MIRIYSVVVFFLNLYVVRFTTFLQMNASQMNIHAAIITGFLPAKIVIKGLSSWSNNASGASRIIRSSSTLLNAIIAT